MRAPDPDPADRPLCCHAQRCKVMFGVSWAALRQELADTMDQALDSYWGTMRGADPDAVLLSSQTEVCTLCLCPFKPVEHA